MQKKTKGKAPAFQFYASDFYMDTISWSDDMVGLHIRLMCQQWINGSIHVDESGYPVNLTKKQIAIFDKIKHKYLAGKKGEILNKKLNNIKRNRESFIKNARKSGAVGASKRWGKNGVANSEPYSESIALQSSVFSLQSSVNTGVQADPFFEYFKIHTSGIPDEVLGKEVKKFRQKYPEKKDPGKCSHLLQTWCSNIEYDPNQLPEKKKMHM